MFYLLVSFRNLNRLHGTVCIVPYDFTSFIALMLTTLHGSTMIAESDKRMLLLCTLASPMLAESKTSIHEFDSAFFVWLSE